jgi:hypothetical protein
MLSGRRYNFDYGLISARSDPAEVSGTNGAMDPHKRTPVFPQIVAVFVGGLAYSCTMLTWAVGYQLLYAGRSSAFPSRV